MLVEALCCLQTVNPLQDLSEARGKRRVKEKTSVMGSYRPHYMSKPPSHKHKVLFFPNLKAIIAYGGQCKESLEIGNLSERGRKPLHCLDFVEGTTN